MSYACQIDPCCSKDGFEIPYQMVQRTVPRLAVREMITTTEYL